MGDWLPTPKFAARADAATSQGRVSKDFRRQPRLGASYGWDQTCGLEGQASINELLGVTHIQMTLRAGGIPTSVLTLRISRASYCRHMRRYQRCVICKAAVLRDGRVVPTVLCGQKEKLQPKLRMPEPPRAGCRA